MNDRVDLIFRSPRAALQLAGWRAELEPDDPGEQELPEDDDSEIDDDDGGDDELEYDA